ncbi:uncharacterized protein LOC129097657 [Anoplopoma fimbria]|uniref:uncharacterized protein LOC129097657 n=1 Tax=Anoplopoma fimbria TaxID=229290 RepID=UPI0023EAE197|nr:uncharacterized protein LOC129097657 [Anoplopoma fimbria]
MNMMNMMNMKLSVRPYAPCPRSAWIHPHVPNDNFDRVCKNIWRRANEAKEELRGQSSPERQNDKDCRTSDSKPSHRAEEHQKEADDLGLSTRYEENKQQRHTAFTLPRPYLSGHRHPHVAKPARELNPVMEEEMKRKEEAKWKKKSEEDARDKQSNVANYDSKIWYLQSSSEGEEQSSETEPEPPVTNPVCSTDEGHTLRLEDEEVPSLSKCESEGEKNIISSCDSNSSDDDNDFVALPRVRSCGTDNSDGDSESENNDCDEEENEFPHSFDELSSDSEQDSPVYRFGSLDFPPLSTIKAGIPPCPTERPASGKMHSQWEMPRTLHPHDIPTATLAGGVTAHAQAPVQGEAKAPQANSQNIAPPPSAAPTQLEAYDLSADFPALQPPKKPLALGELRDGNPKTKGPEGKRRHTRPQNQCQESGASHQRRMENVPHEVSSICAGDQKSVLDLQTFGQGIPPPIICEELKANNQLLLRVAGTDGLDAYARSWASAAKGGMKQAAAPQEKARPCTFQSTVTINRAKARYSAVQNFPNKVIPSCRAATPMCHGPRPRNPNTFVRPGYPAAHQHFGAQVNRANCPPGVRYPLFPFQQTRGKRAKHTHV